tara:strand:+ start:18311 stop:19378 length:1068 start_codon:yes stop_codon:yes gene_type:complete
MDFSKMLKKMNSFYTHISKVAQATKAWLQPDNKSLKEAIERTVSEGLFSLEDIKFQIRALKQKVDAGQVEEWASRANLSESKNSVGQKVLCLHAGNLPLVGFQDALGTILSGADYYGKLSSKDPYLLKSFLLKLDEFELKNNIEFSTNLSKFKNLNADKVLFAGSEQSVEPVKEKLYNIGAVDNATEFIIRTAKFSIAYLDNEDPDTLRDLIEAVFRYGGKGCRSVAIIVSPYSLEKVKCHFTDYVEEFWLKNPQHQKPKENLAYQFAFNKAVERDQAWLDDFLVQETDEFPDQEFTLNWVQGNHQKLKKLHQKFGNSVQSVYRTGENIEGIDTEFLSTAQTPDLWWEPDGVGVI